MAENARAASPSFDCSKASATLDRLVCGDDDLSELDRELADAYNDRLARSAGERDRWIVDQRAWLADRGFTCKIFKGASLERLKERASASCLKKLYSDRRDALAQGEFFYRPLKPTTVSPSFECGNATTVIERLICSDDGLSSLDTEIANVYKARLARNPGESDRWMNDQRLWLSQRTSSCFASVENAVSQTWRTVAIKCLSDMYRKRKDQLAHGGFLIEPPKVEAVKAPMVPPQARHFELVMSKDDAVCKPLFEFYHEIERELLANRDERWEDTHSDALKSLGFVIPQTYVPQTPLNLVAIWESRNFSMGGHFVQTDIFGDGVPRLIAMGNGKDRQTGDIGVAFADVFPLPTATDLSSERSARAFLSNSELRMLSGEYSDPPQGLDWQPVETYGVKFSDHPSVGVLSSAVMILSDDTRIFPVVRDNRFYWIEREFAVNSEVRLFRVVGHRLFRDGMPVQQESSRDESSARAGDVRLAKTEDVCYVSPNIEHGKLQENSK